MWAKVLVHEGGWSMPDISIVHMLGAVNSLMHNSKKSQ